MLISLAPLEIHSIPNEPTPQYKSKTFENLKSFFILFECKIILNKLSLTKSLKGLVVSF